MDRLTKEFLEELEDRKDIFTDLRYKWLRGLGLEPTLEKAYCAAGYLMAMRDTGHNIGELKKKLELVIIELKED